MEECYIITKESLLAAQKEDLRRVMELLALSEQHARTLLIFYRWDVERIFDFLERNGKEKFFSEAGITIKARKAKILRGAFTCEVCFDDISSDATTEMDCGHRFCNECWTEHFILKITEGQSRRISCMALKCNTICDEEIVRSLVGIRNQETAYRFDNFLLRSYIDDNDKVKWCPSVPHCGNAVRVEGELHCEVECKCGLQFCFACLSEPHSPCSCNMWKLWKKNWKLWKKLEDESETVSYLTAHTKSCPKCGKPVEKNGGCNLVVCICQQAFCWLCGGATGHNHTWDNIEGHTCKAYKEEDKNKTQPADHYTARYYHNRCKAHSDSLKQESNLKLKESIKLKVSISESDIEGYSWVMDALNMLLSVRRILSYSYPFAFYMFGDELEDEMTTQERELKKFMFEGHQQMLESYVEQFSMFLEHDFSDSKIFETKVHVLRLSDGVDRMCKRMYQYIENDLLYPLKRVHDIAPYKSKGHKRA